MKYKNISLGIVGLLLVVLLISSVSGLDWDNKKTYIPSERKAIIDNAFGFGDRITEVIHLNEQSRTFILNDVCEAYKDGFGYNCRVAEFNIDLRKDYNNFISKVELYNIGKGFKKENINYLLKEKVQIGTEEKPIYNYVCSIDKVNRSESCDYEIIDYETIPVYSWETLNKNFKSSNKIVGLYIDKIRSGEHYEFIPTIAGARIEEWADFTGYTRYEYMIDEGIGATTVFTSGSARGQGFRIGLTGANESFTIVGMNLDFRDDADTGTTVVRIANADSSGIPTGADVANITLTGGDVPNTPIAWFNMSNSYNGTLIQGQTYAWYVDLSSTLDLVGESGNTYPTLSRIRDTGGGFATDGTDDLAFEIYGIPLPATPTITLNAPENNSITSNANVLLNWSVEIGQSTNLTNTSLYIDGAYNQTIDYAGALNQSLEEVTLNFGDGLHYWYVDVWGENGETATSNTRYFTVDTTTPVINIVLPTNNTNYVSYAPSYNVSINASISDNLGLDSCWYSNQTDNNTFNCNSNITAIFGSGWKDIDLYANDTANNIGSDRVTFFINVVNVSWNYQEPIIEQEAQVINFYLTADTITAFNGTINYNNTEVVPTSISYNSTFANMTLSLTSPLVDSNQQVPLFANYSLNGQNYTSPIVNQTVQILTDLVVSSSCTDEAIRFDIKDEQNLSLINGTVDYNLKFGLNNDTLKTVYGTITNVPTFYVCINASVSENYTLGYGEFDYLADSYENRRYYLFEGQTLSNNTLTNHTLYEILSSEQTSFIIEAENTDLSKYVEKFIALWRWYPALNEYRVVDMGQTDENGETVSHVETEDVDYRVGLYERNGSLLKLGDPVRFVCSSAPCRFTLTVDAGEVDFTNFLNVESSLTYNETSKVFTYIYNDVSQSTAEMNLLVKRITGTSELTICDTSTTGYTGVLSCDASAYTGTFKAVAYRTASPATPIAQKVVSATNTVFKDSKFGLFVSMILWLAIVLTGFSSASFSPIIILILGIVGLIPGLLIGSITPIIFTGFIVFIAIIIHFIKRSTAYR